MDSDHKRFRFRIYRNSLNTWTWELGVAGNLQKCGPALPSNFASDLDAKEDALRMARVLPSPAPKIIIDLKHRPGQQESRVISLQKEDRILDNKTRPISLLQKDRIYELDAEELAGIHEYETSPDW